MTVKPTVQRVYGPARRALADSLKSRYERGESIRDLADDTGRSYAGIHQLLTLAGVKFRPRGGPRPARPTT